jgi:large subunit ribosomal protein L1
MDKNSIKKALEQAKKDSKKRNFTQRVDLIVNLKDLNIKKTEEQLNVYAELPHETGRPIKVCGLVGGELTESSKKNLDFTITVEEFDAWAKDKKKVKKLARDFDYFIAEGSIMAKVARAFGRILGTQGKLPNPKAGCVVQGNADLAALKKKLAKTVRLVAKSDTSIKCAVGNEKSDEALIIDNVLAVYTRLKATLPKEEQNIKQFLLKLTMGPAVEVAK